MRGERGKPQQDPRTGTIEDETALDTEIERVVGAERFDAGQGAVRTDIGFFDDFDDDFDERAIRGDVAVAAEERRDGASSE